MLDVYYYPDRLINKDLLSKSFVIETGSGISDFAVPVDETRVSGDISFEERDYAETAFLLLRGFTKKYPDLRLIDKWYYDEEGIIQELSLEWGMYLPAPNDNTHEEYIKRQIVQGQMYGYTDEAIEEFIERIETNVTK
jgi:hypothetical protein